MLGAILDNPIAVREWRVLRRRAGDWRIWVGVKWPLDPIVWGAPVILTYALAPYALWGVLALLKGLRLTPAGTLPFDAFGLLALVFWIYVVVISLVLGATAVSGERERQTWDQIQVTPLTSRERAVGLLWGRIGPVWASLVLTSLLWWLLHPHYVHLSASYMEQDVTRRSLAAGSLVVLCLSVMAGMVGLLDSARSKRSAVAVVMAVLRFTLAVIPLAFMGAVAGLMTLMSGRDESGTLALWAFVEFWIFVALCLSIWDGLRAALGAQ